MAKQFQNMDCSRGAPTGRRSYGEMPTGTRSIKLYLVNLDNGGYDDGGAYWGGGMALYCAESPGGNYRDFVRAVNRKEAAQRLGIKSHLLIKVAT